MSVGKATISFKLIDPYPCRIETGLGLRLNQMLSADSCVRGITFISQSK
jgi:hypothetical protein